VPLAALFGPTVARNPTSRSSAAKEPVGTRPIVVEKVSGQFPRMKPNTIETSAHRYARGVLRGSVVGLLIMLPALCIALLSGAAGHGDYIAARALFPVPMLLTRFTGSIGVISLGTALLQFPLYGAVLGWSILRDQRSLIAALAVIHATFATICFAGALPNFS
jgi:hypothetical protein